MITIKTTGAGTLECNFSGKQVTVFPEKAGSTGSLVELLPSPEESPTPGTISWPGEYDKDGVSIRGIGHNEGATVSYAVEVDNIRLAFLSSPLVDLSDHELELLGDIAILAIPADDAKIVQRLLDDIDPRILIPLPTGDAAVYNEVLKACGAAGAESQEELKIKGGLPAEGREVVVLK